VQSIDALLYLTITGQSLLLDAPTLYLVQQSRLMNVLSMPKISNTLLVSSAAL